MLAIVFVAGMFSSFFIPVPVQAATDLSQINLVLGGEGATSWAIPAVMPCSSGTKTITLHNSGSEDGSVIIWLSDILSTEGQNPESETDIDDANGGELDDNLLLGVSASSGLSSNITMPTTINDFPQSVDDTDYIHVDLLTGGGTITLTWDWLLPCDTGNEAQGDIVIFTLNFYLEDFLEELPPTEPESPDIPSIPPFEPEPEEEPTGCNCPGTVRADTSPCLCTATSNVDLGELPACYQGNTVAAVTNDAPLIFPLGNTVVTWTMTDLNGNRWTCEQIVTVRQADFYFAVDMLGQITKVNVNCPDYAVIRTSIATDPDNEQLLTIERGTHVICPDSNQCFPYPEVIVMSVSDQDFPVPDGMTMIGPAYDFTGYQDEELFYPACSFVNFDQPVFIQLSYDPDDPLIADSTPYIAYFDVESGQWKKIQQAPGVVAEVGKATGQTDHFSTFAVMVGSSGEEASEGLSWWIILAIIIGSVLLFFLIFSRRRKKRRSQTTAS